MKRPAIFFDRDNTLIVSDGYLGDPAKVVLVDGAAHAVARARQLGFATVVVSNQSGVARGLFDEEAVHAVNARVDEMLLAAHPGAVIDRHAFCPYHPDGTVPAYRHDSQLRKPKPGMILEAARTLALDLSRSWVIGDAPRDVEAGVAAGCRTILFHDPNLPTSPAAHQDGGVRAEYVVSTLREAIEYVERHPHPPEASGDDASVPGGSGADADEDDDEPADPLPPPPWPTTAAPSPAIRLLAQPAIPGTGKDVVPPRLGPHALAASSSASTGRPEAGPSTGAPLAGGPSTARLENLVEQLLQETRRQRELPDHDFSVPKLLAGVVQVLALGALVLAYFIPDQAQNALLVAIVLQSLTTTLLLMGRR